MCGLLLLVAGGCSSTTPRPKQLVFAAPNSKPLSRDSRISARPVPPSSVVSPLSALSRPRGLLRPDRIIPPKRGTVVQTGLASWYGPRFHGRLTANGERYNQYALTAAHKTLPFGSRVRVTNLKTGQVIEVRINDRGPFIRGRVIDLSYAAARRVGVYKPGTAQVQIEVLAADAISAQSGYR